LFGGETPVLDAAEWRKLIDSIPTDTVRDLRDRALIATLTYSFARITAALKMKVEDLQPKGSGWLIRLHEKGGKHHAMPCHHSPLFPVDAALGNAPRSPRTFHLTNRLYHPRRFLEIRDRCVKGDVDHIVRRTIELNGQFLRREFDTP
jgi:integrase